MEKRDLYKRIEHVASDINAPIDTFEDLFQCLKEIYEEEDGKAFVFWHIENARLKIAQKIKKALRDKDYESLEKLDKVLYHTYLLTARDKFHDFCIALEWGRLKPDKFYEPRMKTLSPLVNALQDLADDKLDELFLSMPPRVGKTTMVMFYMIWLLGKNSEKSNLYVSYSDTITSAFYNGVLEILQDNVTYRYRDIFYDDNAKIESTNAKEETLDLGRKKRYHSLTARSLYGTLNGATDCSGLLVADDLISGIEEALNPDRLVSAWAKVDNNMIPRKKEKAKLLWVGTRWSMYDPTGIRYDLLMNDEKFKNVRYKIINVPALDEKDESNFDYDYGVGFTSEYYKQRRASFERNNDMASWLAQYQGEPIERQGTVFDPQDMRYFNGVLPETKPDRKFMVVDPAWGGGDYVAAPICYQYGEDIYVVDVVYSNEEKNTTQPMLARAIKKYEVEKVQVEATKTTAEFKDGINDYLRELGYHCTMTYKSAPNNKAKEQRIFDKASDIREKFVFLEDGQRSKEYNLFMQNVYSFKITGKNKHDDAPDSLCMACDMAFYQSYAKVEIFKRMF